MRRKPFIFGAVLFIVIISIIIFFASRLKIIDSLPFFSQTPANTKGSSSCGFLEEKYCNDGTIEDVEYDGNSYRVVGFKLPAGVEIKVPLESEVITGAFDETSTLPLKGDSVIITKKQDLSQRAIIVGDLEIVKYDDWIRPQGAIVAKISKGNKTNLNGYNMVIMFMDSTDGKEAPNQEMLNRYF